jgi:hypothetical protein
MQLLTADAGAVLTPPARPDLERVINCNLARLSRLLRILRFHDHDLNHFQDGQGQPRATYAIHPTGRENRRSTPNPVGHEGRSATARS